jgi:hypothetical protein
VWNVISDEWQIILWHECAAYIEFFYVRESRSLANCTFFSRKALSFVRNAQGWLFFSCARPLSLSSPCHSIYNVCESDVAEKRLITHRTIVEINQHKRIKIITNNNNISINVSRYECERQQLGLRLAAFSYKYIKFNISVHTPVLIFLGKGKITCDENYTAIL